jgi:GAF domain-containing protein
MAEEAPVAQALVDPEAVLGVLPLGITVQDRTGALVYVNEEGGRLLGFGTGRETAETATSEILARFEFVDEDGTPVALENLPGRRVLRGEHPGPLVVRVRNLLTGEEAWRTVTAIPIVGAGGEVTHAVNIFRDITTEKLAQQRLEAEYAVASVLAAASSLEEAAPRILEAICRSLLWDVGILWQGNLAEGRLGLAAAWHGGEPALQAFVDRSAEMTFSRGMAFPGMVWESGEPAWIRDVSVDDSYARAEEAKRAELRGACGFALRRGDEVFGVMEFYTRKVRIPDPQLLPMLGTLGSQVGMFALRQDAEARQRYLVEAGEELARSLDYEETLRAVAVTAVPAMADVCLVYVRDEETGEIRRVAMEGVEESLAAALPAEYPIDPHAAQGVPKVIQTGEPELHPEANAALMAADVYDRDRLQRMLEPLGIRSWMCLPLIARGRTFGAISFVSAASGRRFDAGDLALAQDVVRRAALQVDNALLYRDAEDAQRRLAFVAEASRVLSGSLNYDRTLSRVAELMVPRLADWCVVDVLGEDGGLEEVAIAHVEPEKAEWAREVRQRYPEDPDGPGIGEVLRTGEPVLYPEVPDQMLVKVARDEDHLRLLRGLGMRSIIIVPLIARNRTLGTMTLVSAESGRAYTHRDLTMASDLASRAAVAVDNARLFRERSHVARTLQRSLLPPALPQVRGIELTARYRPAQEGVDIGGDFYDVFAVGKDDWAVVIGDVCGKGIEAAALTGLVRHSIRAAVRQGNDGPAALEVLNEEMRSRSKTPDFCTLAYAQLRPANGTVEAQVVCAGHPPPLVIRATGEVERAGSPGTLLGVVADIELHPRSVTLGPGDALFLYTDGLVEGFAGDEGVEAVLRGFLAATVGEGAEGMAEIVERATTGEHGATRDDSAFVIARVTKPATDPSV